MKTSSSILILTPFFRPNIGGVESYLDDLCRYLVRRGRRVTVITYQPLTSRFRGPALEKEGTLEIRRIPWFGRNWFHNLERHPFWMLVYLAPGLFVATFFYLARRSGDIAVIHAQGLTATLVARLLAPLFGRPVIASTCAVYGYAKGTFRAAVARWVFAGCAKVFALGECSRRELTSIGVPEEKVTRYHLWMDLTEYRPDDKARMKNALGLGDAFLVLYVGRFIPAKGVDLLLQIARQVPEKIRFCFIGDHGPLYDAVAAAEAAGANVTLVKDKRGRELIPYYQAADVVAVPSLYSEAFGKVIIEAFACGTPVIGADRGFIPSVIDRRVGRVVEPTPDIFKKEILNLFEDRPLLNSLTAAARRYAEENFGETNAEVIYESYAHAD